MRVLIVEDSAFNALCLRRIMETSLPTISVAIATNSTIALSSIHSNTPDLVIIDGDLGAADGVNCNGPVLAGLILNKYPHLPVIAWSDSELMRDAFAKIFMQYKRTVDIFNTWPKVVNQSRVLNTLSHFYSDIDDLSVPADWVRARG